MKTKFYYPLWILVSIFCLTSCSDDDDASVRSISVDPTSATIREGETKELTFTIYPQNAANKNVTWSSSDEDVVTVDKDGLVTAVSVGTAIVTVTAVENGEKAESTITVVNKDAEILEVSGDVSGTWSKNTLVHVQGHITVPEGKSLTIEEGVTVIMSDADQDTNGTKIEFLVLGNLYCNGTEDAPILFSVSADKRILGNAFAGLWGGIIAGPASAEIVLEYVTIEYTGAITTSTSPSAISGLFKAAGGEGMVAFNTNNVKGKYVVMNSTFRYTSEDAIYVQGGECIFMNNLFYANGSTGGEAINVKAGCKVDAGFNVIFSPNTNGFKLSSSGQDSERYQAQIKAYNNTIINAGWRRDPNGIKGGSMYVEKGALVYVFNNLLCNCMFGIKAPGFGDTSTGVDANSVIDYNFYTSGTQESVVPQHIAAGYVTAYDGFKPGVEDVYYGSTHNKSGQFAGDNNPGFINYPFNTVELSNYNYQQDWNFHLATGSPALSGANNTNNGEYAPYFVNAGLTIQGKTYKSVAPATWFGAFGL